jgi:proline iminopeptidase
MKVRVNGVRLYFDVDGVHLVPGQGGPTERPTLIVLHGAPGISDHMSFKPDFAALTDVAQVVYLDLRGGRSQ